MTQTTLSSRAQILRREIETAMAAPNKRTLSHCEAMDIVARVDGFRNREAALAATGARAPKAAGHGTDDDHATSITPGNDWCFDEGPDTARLVEIADGIFDRQLAEFDEATASRSPVKIARHAEDVLRTMARVFAHEAFGACMTRSFDQPNQCARTRLRDHIAKRFDSTMLELVNAHMPDVQDDDCGFMIVMMEARLAGLPENPGHRRVRRWPWQGDGRGGGRSIASDTAEAERSLAEAKREASRLVAAGSTSSEAIATVLSEVSPRLDRALQAGFEDRDVEVFSTALERHLGIGT